VWQRSKAIGIALGSVILILNLQAVWLQSSTLVKSDFRSAAAHVELRRRVGEPLLFQIPYVQYAYAYYAGEAAPLLEGPYTNSGATEGEVAAKMEQLTDGYASLWLISSEAETWDERGLVQDWLSQNGSASDSADFIRVEVTRFDLAAP
jgi:hypothetical protein